MPANSRKKQNIKGLPFDLAGLLSYQKDSVVSRELVRTHAGTMTVFAFDKGQGLSEHTAPFDAIVYLLDGEATITIAKKAFRVAKNNMIIMPAGKPHSLKATKRFKMLLVLIKENP